MFFFKFIKLVQRFKNWKASLFEMKTVIGLTEKVLINGQEVEAKIDTGATTSSIDAKLASKLKLGPIVRTSTVRSSHGKRVRIVVEADLQIKDRKIKTHFNITPRKEMKYKVLIGINILKNNFLIDPSK